MSTPHLAAILTGLAMLFNSFNSGAVERVVSLAPSSTEIAYAAGLGEKMVAASDYSDYPEKAKQLERVAAYNTVNIERVIALNPDLIVAWRSGASMRVLNQLKDLGFTIFYTDTDSLDEIATRIEELSKYADDPEHGQQIAKTFRDRLKKLRATYAQKQKISYFYQISGKPLITLAQRNWPSEIFELCGGVNIFEASSSPYPQVSLEQVLAYAPQIIFTSAHATQDTQQWMPWSAQIPAVAENRIWSLNADWLNRPTPRSLNAVEEVCTYIEKARSD